MTARRRDSAPVEIAGPLQRARGGERWRRREAAARRAPLRRRQARRARRVVTGEGTRLTEEQRGAQAGAAGAEPFGVFEHGDGGTQLAALDQPLAGERGRSAASGACERDQVARAIDDGIGGGVRASARRCSASRRRGASAA